VRFLSVEFFIGYQDSPAKIKTLDETHLTIIYTPVVIANMEMAAKYHSILLSTLLVI